MNNKLTINPVDDELIAFERAIHAIVPTSKKLKEEGCMTKSYAVIEQALVRNVSTKVVLETFNVTYGLKTHPARFRKLLHHERTRRKEGGNLATCEHCGQALMVENKAEDASGTNKDAEGVA